MKRLALLLACLLFLSACGVQNTETSPAETLENSTTTMTDTQLAFWDAIASDGLNIGLSAEELLGDYATYVYDGNGLERLYINEQHYVFFDASMWSGDAVSTVGVYLNQDNMTYRTAMMDAYGETVSEHMDLEYGLTYLAVTHEGGREFRYYEDHHVELHEAGALRPALAESSLLIPAQARGLAGFDDAFYQHYVGTVAKGESAAFSARNFFLLDYDTPCNPTDLIQAWDVPFRISVSDQGAHSPRYEFQFDDDVSITVPTTLAGELTSQSTATLHRGEGAPSITPDDFWDQYVYWHEPTQNAYDLFSSLSFYCFYGDGFEYLFPYEDVVYFSGPAWEDGSEVWIQDMWNRSGENREALLQEAFRDRVERSVQDNLSYLTVTDRGYRIEEYETFTMYYREGAVLPDFSDMTLVNNPAVRIGDSWTAIHKYAAYLGMPEGFSPDAGDDLVFEYANSACSQIALPANLVFDTSMTVLDMLERWHIPFTLYGAEQYSDYDAIYEEGGHIQSVYVYQFSDFEIHIPCGEAGAIRADDVITLSHRLKD